jgi:hypothetical protein
MPNTPIDYTNQTFGSLKAIKSTKQKYHRSTVWELECIKCDSIIFKAPHMLSPESTCGKLECRIGTSIRDLTGCKFDKLTVLNFIDISKNRQVIWNCLCVCGNKRALKASRLVSGNATHCGCLRIEKSYKLPGAAAWNSKWRHFLTDSCNSRNLPNQFSKEDFVKITSKKCFYCNKEPKPYSPYANERGEIRPSHKLITTQETIDRSWIKINGIDRVNNEVGYLTNNSVPCCWECNQMKGSLPFYEWCGFIDKFRAGFMEEIIVKMKKEGIRIPNK